MAKWNHVINEEIDPGEWTAYNRNIQLSKLSVNCQYFQYQIITRSIITKKKLKQFKIIQEDKCSFCAEVTETVEHLFFACKLVQCLWSKVITWLEKENYHKLRLNENLILLGPSKNDPLLYTIITNIQHSIYKNKFKEKIPTLKSLQHLLKNCMTVENYIAMCNSKIHLFLGKWSPIHKCLTDL